MFRAQADGRFVGRGGLRHGHAGGHEEVEFAYALMVAFWGSGLATEMAKAILTIAFEHLGLADLVAFTLATNRASRRVMEKVGCQFSHFPLTELERHPWSFLGPWLSTLLRHTARRSS